MRQSTKRVIFQLVFFPCLCMAFIYLIIFAISHLPFNPGGAVAWMEQHDKLSGWAQFVGATVALLLAITVPAWQRYWQNLDKRRVDAELDLGLSLCSYFLISEVRNHIQSYIDLPQVARFALRDVAGRDDLLKRIHALEQRDNNSSRLSRLFRSRGAILAADRQLGHAYFQQAVLQPHEIEQFEGIVSNLAILFSEAELDKNRAFDDRARANLYWFARFLYPLVSRMQADR